LGLIDRLIDRTMNACRVFSTTQATRVGLKPNTTEFSVSIGTEAKFQSQLKPKNPGRTLQSHIETEIDSLF
jgi:hypothetical protein